MKSTLKKILMAIATLIPASIFSLLVFITMFTFDSSCACVPPIVEFAEYIDVAPIYLNLETVREGFVKKYPKGSTVAINRLSELGEDREITKEDNYIEFDIWLESNLVAKRGYRVSFVLNSDGKSKTVDVKQISSWFGHKSVDNKSTEKVACK